jgi:hypothetical protein
VQCFGARAGAPDDRNRSGLPQRGGSAAFHLPHLAGISIAGRRTGEVSKSRLTCSGGLRVGFEQAWVLQSRQGPVMFM